MTKIVYSFDYDGCLNPVRFAIDPDDFLQINEDLQQLLINKNRNYDKAYVLIGSNRQSFGTEQYNADENINGYAFENIPCFAKEIGAEFIPFWMTDIYNGLKMGTAFECATNEYTNKTVGSHASYLFDELKITLIYAQLQYIALANPNDEIHFEFYDDKATILNALSDFFKKNQQLIPSNITLKLKQYFGVNDNYRITEKGDISGTGIPNSNYQELLRKLGFAILSRAEHENILLDTNNNPTTAEKVILNNYNDYFTFPITADEYEYLSCPEKIEQTNIKHNDKVDLANQTEYLLHSVPL
ncbi:hypothetical protein [Legionella cincinnatiensis]|uniref:Dot/Icm T4SS effector n=1 Tax=Legionella cincinnatiensis TaxID=28085 RepID=A0A378IN65_9GAMM|nr:hypothetical protein [Legionella cincinnatiensis]KTC83040.1 Dot/Icm T4SS effector [Legionella cincinnatiensis]STX35400.1 Dot/Icm secretion system substrate [Legionella cincinnatiensis]STX35769.1 Dot/Icm secretion system substrate [Legionella cincinnatiensis]STX35921.1 Dot/Icm secretion system substrate [Legionella cincinnatiensis]